MEIWHYVLIYVCLSVGVRLAIKAYKAEQPAQTAAPDRGQSGAPRPALLSDPAKMIERSLVFMAAIDNRPKLYGLSAMIATDFMNLNTDPVQKTGEFARKAFDLDRIDADAYRQLLLGSLLNTQYRAQHYQCAPDTTIANICYGLAILSQNTTLDEAEVSGWRLLLLSKAKEVYPTYDAAYDALNRYYKALHKALIQSQKITTQDDPTPEYQRAQEKRAQDAVKQATRFEKQFAALRKLNSDTDWRRHMQRSWERFQPMRFDEITATRQSTS